MTSGAPEDESLRICLLALADTKNVLLPDELGHLKDLTLRAHTVWSSYFFSRLTSAMDLHSISFCPSPFVPDEVFQLSRAAAAYHSSGDKEPFLRVCRDVLQPAALPLATPAPPLLPPDHDPPTIPAAAPPSFDTGSSVKEGLKVASFRDFLLQPDLLRGISAAGFQTPSAGNDPASR
jgi:hypothetical protein